MHHLFDMLLIWQNFTDALSEGAVESGMAK